jgi:hypothetical protein
LARGARLALEFPPWNFSCAGISTLEFQLRWNFRPGISVALKFPPWNSSEIGGLGEEPVGQSIFPNQRRRLEMERR